MFDRPRSLLSLNRLTPIPRTHSARENLVSSVPSIIHRWITHFGYLFPVGEHGINIRLQSTLDIQQYSASTPPKSPSLAPSTIMERFGVIIDAGSSGSRIYIYGWTENPLTIRELSPNNEADKKRAKANGGKPDIYLECA